MSWGFIRYNKKKKKAQELWEISISIFFNIFIRLRAEHSSRREDREKGHNEQSGPGFHTKSKFQVMEIPARVRAQPSRPSPTTISLPLSSVPTTSVCTSIHSIETSTRSTLETRKAASPLPQTTKSSTRTFAPFLNPRTKKKETAVYSETSKKKSPLRNKRSHAKNETRNMTEAIRHPSGFSLEPREPFTAEAGVSRHFEQDKTTTDKSGLLPTTLYTKSNGLINCCH